METVLNRITLYKLFTQPVMFDANIFMVGIENRYTDPNCSFENMKETYLIPLLESFKNIIIHEEVYNELDQECQKFINSYKNITIVSEEGLYGIDPQYTTIFNNIAWNQKVKYRRGASKNKGEVYSLAYAAFHKINFFCSKEIMVDLIADEIENLKKITIITFDIVILAAYTYYLMRNDTSHNKALKAIYKRYCEDVIKRHNLPGTLKEYFYGCKDLIGFNTEYG